MFLNVPKKVVFVFLTLTIAAIVTESMSSVACFGTNGLSCTEHQLSCSTTQTISIIDIKYGFRQGCGLSGVSSCADITCCTEEAGDCFLPIKMSHLSVLQNDCVNKSTCRTPALREAGRICDGERFSTYSKIIYSCIPANNPTSGLATVFPTANTLFPSSPEILTTPDTIPKTDTRNTTITPTPDTKPNTDTPDIGGIVGGLIGSLLVLAVIVLVGIILFKRKQRKCGKTPTCVYNNKNELLDVNLSEKPTSDYDYITTEGVGKQCLQVYNYNTAEPDIIVGSEGHYKQATQNIDNYNHIGLNISVPSDDNYHHLGEGNSDSIKPVTDTYNHIRPFNHENLGDDTYNHLGSESKPVITDSEYSHIGSDNHGLREGDYQHLGVVCTPSVVTENEYNHVGNVHNEVL